MSIQYYEKGFVVLDRGMEKTTVTVTDGKITAVGGACPPEAQRIDLEGNILVAGFMDIHTHGGAGVDVSEADEAGLDTISRFFASKGVTGWLASVLSDEKEKTLKVLRGIARYMEKVPVGARLLGVHLEGPFLAGQFRGCMNEAVLRQGSAEAFMEYQQAAGGHIRYVTLAPEVSGVSELIPQLAAMGVRVAIGHSGADYETAMGCIKNGAVAATHTFNAMRQLHHHDTGIIGAVLESDVYCEAICDGRHLHPATVRLLLKCKGYDRVVAITDSIMAAGMPDGDYRLGPLDVRVVDGDATLREGGTRAGSTLTMDAALRNIMAFTGEPLWKVVPLLSKNPAEAIGLGQSRGRILPGYEGAFTILTRDGTVVKAVVA